MLFLEEYWDENIYYIRYYGENILNGFVALQGHNMAEWCSDCGCIHLDKLLSEQPEDGGSH